MHLHKNVAQIVKVLEAYKYKLVEDFIDQDWLHKENGHGGIKSQVLLVGSCVPK